MKKRLKYSLFFGILGFVVSLCVGFLVSMFIMAIFYFTVVGDSDPFNIWNFVTSILVPVIFLVIVLAVTIICAVQGYFFGKKRELLKEDKVYPRLAIITFILLIVTPTILFTYSKYVNLKNNNRETLEQLLVPRNIKDLQLNTTDKSLGISLFIDRGVSGKYLFGLRLSDAIIGGKNDGGDIIVIEEIIYLSQTEQLLTRTIPWNKIERLFYNAQFTDKTNVTANRLSDFNTPIIATLQLQNGDTGKQGDREAKESQKSTPFLASWYCQGSICKIEDYTSNASSTRSNNNTSLETLSAEYKALKQIPSYFGNGEWNDDIDKWGGKKQQVMEKLGKELGNGSYTKSKVIDLLGSPDMTARSSDKIYQSLVLSNQQGNNKPEEILIYFWRGMHDYLYFNVEKGIIVSFDWFYSYE